MYTNEMLDAIIIGIDANKRDLEFHKLNLERYDNILKDDDLEEWEFKTKLMNEISVLQSRIKEVTLIIKYTEMQLEGVSEKDIIASRERIALQTKQQ